MLKSTPYLLIVGVYECMNDFPNARHNIIYITRKHSEYKRHEYVLNKYGSTERPAVE